MKLRKIIAIAAIGTMLLNVVPASAASIQKHGYTMYYTKERVSNTKAQATTSCAGAKGVSAIITATYNYGNRTMSETAANSSTVATTATITLPSGAYITNTSSKHQAVILYQGYYETIDGSL